jgi:hypothetical protein
MPKICASIVTSFDQTKLPVQLEGIWTISVSSILLQVFWKVDDFNRIKWAFLTNITGVRSMYYIHTDIMQQ